MSSMTENSDPYLYPGTNVLKNLRGLTDPKQLARFEARRTHRRIAELIDTPMPWRFDIAHLKAIHRYISQDVYEWAGQFREGDGRTQREFIREVGLQAGHYIDWRATTPEERPRHRG